MTLLTIVIKISKKLYHTENVKTFLHNSINLNNYLHQWTFLTLILVDAIIATHAGVAKW